MAAVDLVAIFESRWFGRQRPPEDLGDGPPLLYAAPTLKRGSAGSLSDGAANEQGEGWTAAGRDRRRDTAPATHRDMRASRRLSIEEEANGILGTWAGRQRIFSDHLHEKDVQEKEQQAAAAAHRDLAAQAAAAAAATADAAPDAQQRSRPQPAQPRGDSPPIFAPAMQQRSGPHTDTSLDRELNAAWRWRFSRKWQAEQLKQFEPPPPPSGNGGIAEGGDEEEWASALQLINAVDGGGLNMQIGRTLSLNNSSLIDHSMEQSMTLLSPGLSQCMLLDNSVKESPLRDEAVTATTHIVSVARKAQHLRQQQQEIERQVTERWEAASSGSQWVAQHLPAVQIDNWSTFTFVLVRLSEQRAHRQKLLVRGRNGTSEQQTFTTTEQEAARVASAHRLAGPRVELVASGRMEWVAAAAGQRRTLHIKASRLHPPAAQDSRLRSATGVSAVVAELTRASFPSGDFDIEANGEATGAAAPSGSGAQQPITP